MDVKRTFEISDDVKEKIDNFIDEKVEPFYEKRKKVVMKYG